MIIFAQKKAFFAEFIDKSLTILYYILIKKKGATGMKRIKFISFILAVCILFTAFPAFALDNNDGESRVYFYNIASAETATADFIILESNGRFGLIDTGHRYSEEIQDARGVHLIASMENGLSSQIENKNAVDAVRYMNETIGITHLDFIIATHAHSDHIGGVPEISAYTFTDSDGVVKHLVDENTVYFYKEYHHVNSINDDLEGYTPESWHSQAFYFQAVRSAQKQGAALVELSKGSIIDADESVPSLDYSQEEALVNSSFLSSAKYNAGNNYDCFDDNFSFNFGTLHISLYNIFAHPTGYDDNVNSIVASITDGNLHFVSLADINVEYKAEQKIAAAINRDFGYAHLLKAAHHGAYFGSNSKEMLDNMMPSYVVATRRPVDIYGVNPSGAYSLAMDYCRKRFNTRFYETGNSDFALVAQFGEEDFSFFNLVGKGDDASMSAAFECESFMTCHDGWSKWDNEIGETAQADYYYFLNGELVTGWLKDGNYYYLLDDDGRMLTGWQYVGEKWYYLLQSGRMRTGWTSVDGVWYYFETDGSMVSGWQNINNVWYYFAPSGAMQTGWKYINSKWYCFNDSGAMLTGWQNIDSKWYLFADSGAMLTGWQKVGARWYYMTSSGEMMTGWCRIRGYWYFFAPSGAMQTGWKRINGIWYYFYANGSMATGEVRIGSVTYQFSPSGAWIRQ